MSPVAIVAIVLVLLALAAVVLLGAMRRRENEQATGSLSRETCKRDRSKSAALADDAPPVSGRDVERSASRDLVVPSKAVVAATPTTPVPWVPPDPETIGVTRRQFLNRSIVNVMGFSITAFGLACIGFLWPSGTGGFGSKIRIGKISDIKANIKANQGFAYYPEARMWATEYPSSALEKARRVYPDVLLPVLEAGVVPLYQRCVHLGCRVPECKTSQWFECPCHGSQYNRVGEKKGGPAPRGLDRFTPELDGDILTVDTGNVILGPPIGTNTTGQEAEGPHCISGGGEHEVTSLATVVAPATVYRTIGLVIMAITFVAVIVYVLVNVMASGKPEVGSEIELAPNRKPYLSDEELETRKLDKALTWGLGTLFVIGLALPLYWVMEPGRGQSEAVRFNNKFVNEGRKLFETTANAGLNCAGCHGGMNAPGGVASATLLKPDGSFDKQVNWKAPALNTVLLRYSREEVTYILTYGRPFSPMPAWGIAGNGPLNDQQIQNLIDYLETIQITPEESQAQVEVQLRKQLGLAEDAEIDYDDAAVGEALFNLGFDGFAGGAYACGRCHSQEWSYSSSLESLPAPGCGALGPSLCGDSVEEQFPPDDNPAEGTSIFQTQIDFITLGSENGKRYGTHGQGSGKMPSFGVRPAEKGLFWIAGGADRPASGGMLSDEMIQAIVEYERSL